MASRIYTKTGDDGTTALGSGRRVAKDEARIEAYGTVDELNAALGAALAAGLDARLAALAAGLQGELLELGAELAVPAGERGGRAAPAIEARHVAGLESAIDELSAELAPLANFILPGGSAGASLLHLARTVCRRAERRVVTLGRAEPLGPHTGPYLNRLSDLLFVMARYENRARGVADQPWRRSPPA